MVNSRLLTKSRFALAIDCPTKLFYTKKDAYPDKSTTDEFLKALAEGGFQVGELARCYYPGGVMIEDMNYITSVSKTSELLKNKNVTIFEAAISFGDLFIRTDILEKKGNNINLIEVKSKSFDEHNDDFHGKKGGLTKGWLPYLLSLIHI